MKQPALKKPSEKLEFTIAHRPRVTKRLHLELDKQGGLVVVAPKHWSRAHISTTLSQNTASVARFLTRARQRLLPTLSQNTASVARFLTRARQRLLPPLQYARGENHLYLGETYSLVIVRGSTRKSRFDISSGCNQVRNDGLVSKTGFKAIL